MRYSLLKYSFLPVLLLGLWILYHSVGKETEPAYMPAYMPAYILFLDVDGTLTARPGVDPKGLFYQYQIHGEKFFQNKERVLELFEGSDEKLQTVKEFLQAVCSLPREVIEIVIVTNNSMTAVEKLWTEVFQCPWQRINPKSGFRDSLVNKSQLISEFARTHGKAKMIYFEDDPIYLQSKLPSLVKIVDCSKRWLYHHISDSDKGILGFLDNL